MCHCISEILSTNNKYKLRIKINLKITNKKYIIIWNSLSMMMIWYIIALDKILVLIYYIKLK
jgi:hypothetical protein